MNNLFFPGTLENVAKILDRLYPRISAENQFYGPSVIGIHIKGKLFVPRQFTYLCILQYLEILIQFALLFFETPIVYRPIFDILLQKLAIEAVIYR